jgi:predicted dehydrogenase
LTQYSGQPLRAAVIGCGWIGSAVSDDPLADGVQSHAGAYVACPNTRLVGVCDSVAARAQLAARRWGLERGFQSVPALLAEIRPEIVSVCTPDANHAELLRTVLEAPVTRAVVAEKPLALSLEEARELVQLAARRNIVLAVNYSRRFAASHIEAQAAVAAGRIGRLLAVQGAYVKGVRHNGTHWFDLARWMMGEIVRVQAWPGASDADSADPTCHLRLWFAGGQSGSLLGLDAAHFTIFEMDLIGSAGRLRLTDSGMRLSWSEVAPSRQHSGYHNLMSHSEVTAGFRDVALSMVEDVVSALHTGRAPRCSGQDGTAALAVAQAARASLSSGAEQMVEKWT